MQEEICPFEGEEITDFLKAIQGNPSEALFYIAINTGMRLSELLGLRWSRVDFKKSTIKVDAQMLVKRGTGTDRRLGSPKNDKVRTFKAPQSVMQMLKAVQLEQKENRLKSGGLWENNLDLVFTNELGTGIPHSTVEHRYGKIVAGLGLDRRFHDLRHTFATESIRCGVDFKTLSEMLGHYSVAFTLDVYGHVTKAMQDDAAQRLELAILERKTS
ncbi:MAG: site-specific integrase [Oscillospiraceae bacterium]|nr:site-specific integrase [Oscillospiraceae bacterium]